MSRHISSSNPTQYDTYGYRYYCTPNGSERGPGRDSKSDRRARTTWHGGRRSRHAAHHRARTRAHDKFAGGGTAVRPRQRACRPKICRLVMPRVCPHARVSALRSARSAACPTCSAPSAPLPTCPPPAPRRCTDRTPAGPPRGTQTSTPTRPRDGRRMGGHHIGSTRRGTRTRRSTT